MQSQEQPSTEETGAHHSRDEPASGECRASKRQRRVLEHQQGLRKNIHDINKLDIPAEEKSRRIQVMGFC